MKPSFWQEWRPPQTGALRAPGRARLGVLPWCLIAICHAWDVRQAALALARSEELRRKVGHRVVRVDPSGQVQSLRGP